jgi:hypothetical protein
MFRAGIIVALAMLLIAAAPIPGSESIQHRTEHTGKKPNDAHTKNDNAKNPSPSATAAPGDINKASIDAATRAAYEAGKHDGEGAIKWTDRAIVVLTGGLVFAALLQFGAALLQWGVMGRQERQMRRSIIEGRRAANRQSRETQISLAIAKQAAEAAQRSADAAVGAERAWLLLSIDGDNLEEAILQRIDPSSYPNLAGQEPIRPEIRCHFDNLGRTPAFIREAAMELVISAGVPERVVAEPTAPWWPEEIIIPAAGRYPLGDNDDGTPRERFAWIRSGEFDDEKAKLFDIKTDYDERTRFWFIGHVLYTDVWGNLHMTRFCMASEVWSNWYLPPEAMQYNKRT